MGRVALAAHQLEGVRKTLARVVGILLGLPPTQVNQDLSTKQTTHRLCQQDGLQDWARRTERLIERRHELVHAVVGVRWNANLGDDGLLLQPFKVLRHGKSGRETAADEREWNRLAEEIQAATAEGDILHLTAGIRFWRR